MAGQLDSLTADTRVERAQTAISTEVDGELVALDVTQGVCYGLNRIGTRIWQLTETPRSAREVAEILVSEFDVAPEVCTDQSMQLFSDLIAAGLLTPMAPGKAGDQPAVDSGS
jgi:hypothetical protein